MNPRKIRCAADDDEKSKRFGRLVDRWMEDGLLGDKDGQACDAAEAAPPRRTVGRLAGVEEKEAPVLSTGL